MTGPSQAADGLPRGLVNYGLTCFLNVDVQVMFMDPVIRQTVMQYRLLAGTADPANPEEAARLALGVRAVAL